MIGTMTSGTGLKFTAYTAETTPFAMVVDYNGMAHIESLKSKTELELYDELIEKILERTNVTRSDVRSDLRPVRAGDTFVHKGIHYEVTFHAPDDGLSSPVLRNKSKPRDKGIVLFGLFAKWHAGSLCVLEKDLTESMN